MSRSAFSSLLKAGLASCLVSLLYVGVFHPLRIFEMPVLKTQDVFFAARHFFPARHPVAKDIFLITVDDESIERVGERWPFKRRIYAQLLDQIEAGHPLVVGMDFIFAGKGEPLDDFILSEAIQRSGQVILASFVDTSGNYVLSLKDLRDEAAGSGIVNKLLDRDFYVRRSHLIYRDQTGKVVGWPWEIEILASLLKLDKEKFTVTPKGLHLELASGQKAFLVPFHKPDEALINYRFRLDDLDPMPLWQALEAKDFSARVKGKIVLIGATSKVLHDYYHTPLGMMPGVIVNINFLANLITGDFLKSLPLPVNALFLALFVLGAAFVSQRFDVMRCLNILGISSAGVLGLFFYLFCNNYTGDFFTPFLGGWAVFLAVTFYRYFVTWIENIRLRGEVATDPLTGLYNRRFLESRIDSELAKLVSEKRARKTDPFHELSVLMVDIDNFKKINDTYGHQFGDDVIKNVGFSIKESTRKDDVAARFGGEEFCVVLTHSNKEEAIQIADKIRKSVESKKFNYVNQVAQFTVSIGVAAARADKLSNSRALIRASDQALYEAKQTGKNRVCSYHPVS